MRTKWSIDTQHLTTIEEKNRSERCAVDSSDHRSRMLVATSVSQSHYMVLSTLPPPAAFTKFSVKLILKER